ncbi:MAG TPA: tyrosine-type recombinase/integrase [Nakamurella sp.]
MNTTHARGCHEAARRHRAEQLQLLTRLAADSGARRAELAALRFDDLDGSVLTITRATSNEILGTTKGGRTRRITLGPTTVGVWTDLSNRWRGRCPAGARFGPWVCSRDPAHTTQLTTSTLGHWFSAACDRAGHPDVTLHRLRHTVATPSARAKYCRPNTDSASATRPHPFALHVLPSADAQAAASIENMLATR